MLNSQGHQKQSTDVDCKNNEIRELGSLLEKYDQINIKKSANVYIKPTNKRAVFYSDEVNKFLQFAWLLMCKTNRETFREIALCELSRFMWSFCSQAGICHLDI